jgi:hypothetical protein
MGLEEMGERLRLKAKLAAEWLGQETDEPRPEIIEEAERAGGATVRIYVIWNDWGALPQADRSEIIMEACEEALGQKKALPVTVAMGLTQPEAERLGMAATRQYPSLDRVQPTAFASHVRRIATEGNIDDLEALADRLARYAVSGEALTDEDVASAADSVARAIHYGSVDRAGEDGFGIVLLGAVGRSKLKRGLDVSPKELHVLATLSRGRRKPIAANSQGQVANADALAYLAERGVRLT